MPLRLEYWDAELFDTMIRQKKLQRTPQSALHCFPEIFLYILAGERVHRMRAGRRGQRTFIHRVEVLSLVQRLLVFSTSAPAAVGTKHDSLTSFHIALQVNNLRLSSRDVKSTFLIIKIGKNYRSRRTCKKRSSQIRLQFYWNPLYCYNSTSVAVRRL